PTAWPGRSSTFRRRELCRKGEFSRAYDFRQPSRKGGSRGSVISIVRGRCGRPMSAYLVFFLVAVAAASHRHVNDLEDLLLDQRSDSGIVIQEVGTPNVPGDLAFQPIRLVRDVPCPACFAQDVVSTPTPVFLFLADPAQLPLTPSLADAPRPALL